jgi:Zn-dependent protease with chaperone function
MFSIAGIFDYFRIWFNASNYERTIGFLIAIICAIFMLTELYTIIRQKTEPDMFIILAAGFVGGILQGITKDELLAILTALCSIMIYSVWAIRESPVWRELMLASLLSYIVILGGRIIQVVVEWHARTILQAENYAEVTYWGLTGQQWFGIAWNIFIYIFFVLCLIFFGRRFFLVSRLTSPQIIYLLLFGLSYLILWQFENQLNITFAAVPAAIGARVLFASFGTYEIMIITNFLLYLISGPLLHLIFGVKKVEDERVLNLVEEVKENLNITGNVKVGRVKAPILNAFAFGAFFDKRIAFMSNELDDFSDDDIRGIAGHELAHAKRIHTFWLFIITSVTFAITKALQLPATTFDYIFDPNVGTDFLWYYLYNIALLAFSYFFVRMLEGRADRLTMKAGFGKPLAKSLIKLDGFYQGIASEMGLSVYLLTDKKQTKAEKIRFLGDAGRNMYQATINPSKLECFINLIASHPKSAFRVVALTNKDKLKPVKASMFPLLLLIPFVRKKYLKELREAREPVADLIDETFLNKYSKKGLKNYDQLSHISYLYNYYKGKDVVAESKINDKKILAGQVTDIVQTDKITSPISLKLKSKDNGDTHLLPVSDYNINELAVGQQQIFKNGTIGTIVNINTEEKLSFTVEFQKNGETITKEQKIPGVPISYLANLKGKEVYFKEKGITKLATLTDITLQNNDLRDSSITIKMGEQTKTVNADKFIYEFKPFEIYIKKNKLSQQFPLFQSLEKKPVSMQTKDDLDTLVKGKVDKVENKEMQLTVLNEKKEIALDRIEFLYIYEDTTMLTYKPTLSLIDRIFMFFQNRKKLTYIIP